MAAALLGGADDFLQFRLGYEILAARVSINGLVVGTLYITPYFSV
ncbi:hypothetical protein OAS86_01350 [Gammaproteobacteria bacterium]|nr:hypothetical protein [Gammaproteobacteria bacterium]